MTFRIAATLFALALPLAAQAPASAEAETVFYKAFYLEKGQRDIAGAMSLYQQFLDKAPEHPLAKEAATLNFRLLERTGKAEERDAFKAKYSKLLADVRPMPAGGLRGEDGPGGEGRPGFGEGRMDPQARIAELEKQLATAKEEGDDEAVARLTRQIERAKQGGQRGFGGQGGRGGVMGMLRGETKIADMSAEDLQQLKDSLGETGQQLERLRQFNPEMADKLEAQYETLKKALDENKLDDAQKVVDELRQSMGSMRGGRGQRGGAGGGGQRGGNGNGQGEGGGRGV